MKLKNYNDVKDLIKLKPFELEELADDVRKEIYEECMRFEGHLGSNMSVTDITISLLKHFGYEKCRYLYDTSYQAYAFKRLTDRHDFFDKVHTSEGYSIFQEIDEGDPFSGGHTSISAIWAAGYNALKDDKLTIEIIGDGSLATSIGLGGMLNFAYPNNKGLFILNDNKQGIGVNQFNYLDWEKIATGMGYVYYEVENGHDYIELEKAWTFFDRQDKSVFVKVNTIKAYKIPVIPNPDQALHYVMPNHKPLEGYVGTSTYVTENIIKGAIQNNKNAIYFVPGMVYTFGLDKLIKKYPDQIIDGGIAEEVSLVQAAAAANSGKEVYFGVGSSFFQRCYDQIVHDIMRNNSNITIFVFGTEQTDIGDSHHGLYDLNMYNAFENVHIYQPLTTGDLEEFVKLEKKYEGPKIIRLGNYLKKAEVTTSNSKDWVYDDIDNSKVVISYGNAYWNLKNYVIEHKLPISVVGATSLNPMDCQLLEKLFNENKQIYTYEYAFWKNNLASSIRVHYPKQIINEFSFKNIFVGRWGMENIMKQNNMDLEFVTKSILK